MPLNPIIVNENKRTSSETFQFGDPHPHAGHLTRSVPRVF